MPDARKKSPRENRLNDLSGKQWLQLLRSFWISERCAEDRDAFAHPAPFLIRDCEKLIRMFSKEGMTVLDPFAGGGGALIAAVRCKRAAVGIDLNPDYLDLARRRLEKAGHLFGENCRYLVGDARKVLAAADFAPVDYILTSPPYHNILRNNGGGMRKDNGRPYRRGAREGVEFYSDDPRDLGNMADYRSFLAALSEAMRSCFLVLREQRYCTVIMSDFTVSKKEKCVQGDIVRLMEKVGFQFSGTAVLLQNSKPLHPFGYPYAYVINHHHHNMMHFRKPLAPKRIQTKQKKTAAKKAQIRSAAAERL
jgi:DNA modification methylase